MKPYVVALLVVASGVGGILLGARMQPRGGAPLAVALLAPPVAIAAPVAKPAGASEPIGATDCQTARTQLAICMAFHPPASETEVQLAMCRGDLSLHQNRPTLPDCYDFIDFAPIYDRELGEADPSPETLERAKNLSVTDCVQVITWGNRAMRQQQSCLKGDAPPGWKERYGRPITERPFARACRTTDAVNAWFSRYEDRAREMGHKVPHKVWAGAEGDLRLPGPDGGSIPWIPEEVP